MLNSESQSPDFALNNDSPFDAVAAHRINANRENARKSTGPRTPEGKARSSQNALKHGLRAQAAAVAAAMPEDFEPILESFNKDFRPSGAHQEVLVRELALADWRLRLIARMESSFLALQIQAIYETEHPDEDVAEADDHVVSAMMGMAWFHNPNLFALLIRYQGQARRAYYRALKELGLVRTGKADYLSPVNETAAASAQTKPPEAPKTAAAAAGNPTNANAAPPEADGRTADAQTKPPRRTFTVTSRVLSPEECSPNGGSGPAMGS